MDELSTEMRLCDVDKQQLTPMMQQYSEIKSMNKDSILFYRLGDFYEMFFEDAVLASKELDLTLTGKSCGLDERAPMCGIPYHSCEGYISRLIAKGYKVSICEQVEDPKTCKGLVKREIIRTITPGTVTESSMLDENRNNYICSAYLDKTMCGVCFADVSTGEVYATVMASSDISDSISVEFGRFMPSEVVSNIRFKADKNVSKFLIEHFDIHPTELLDECFEYSASCKIIKESFPGLDLKRIMSEEYTTAAMALGGLLTYLCQIQKTKDVNLRNLTIYTNGQFMELDLTARRNLELCETLRTREKRGSLLWVLDQTVTAMGARLLRQWIEKPLIAPEQIKYRQEACSELYMSMMQREEIIYGIKGISDIDRIMSHIVYGTAGARDLRAICETIKKLPAIRSIMSAMDAVMLKDICGNLCDVSDIAELIDNSIVEDPPFSVREGGFIKKGYSTDVDKLNVLVSGGEGLISQIEEKEREKTGIKNLKVGYNRVFGYYIEVTKSFYNLVPAEYIRKQTLASCERYITDELKQLESQVLTAKDRIVALEYDIFCDIRNKVAAKATDLQKIAKAIAELDVLCSLADVGQKYNYCMPEINSSGIVKIEAGRHPVAEKLLKNEMFVPNDTLLDTEDNRMMIITGPNMAGKSTYMRQTALIVIMAQMGAPIPAKSASIGICDRIFTRIGASDDLTAGQSTFMVEMSEVADILKHATKNSLLILDEIGRGTSTFDGMAIARAVLEFAADKNRLGAKTLFATHYHELTALEGEVRGLMNYNIAVKKRGDDITFLRKIVPGAADESYGIEVAKLAGIPDDVISRAKDVLRQLENGDGEIPLAESHLPVIEAASGENMSEEAAHAMEIFNSLKAINVEVLTPIEAMNELYRLKAEAGKCLPS